MAEYYATISHTDSQIGRILEALDAYGLRENTIIVFTSDNGLAVGRHGLMGKQNVYDHSVHVPLILSGPGIPEGELRDQLCYIYDLYPTLCERASVAVPQSVEFKSFNAVFKNRHASHREFLYFAFMSWQRSVQKDGYKLIEYCVNGERHTQLFDLPCDPMEMQNLSNDPEYSETLKKFRALLKKESKRLNDGNTSYDFTNQQGENFWNLYDSTGN